MRLLFTTFLILAAFAYQSSGEKLTRRVVVFWIPPQVETYSPVTGENIEQMAFKIVSLRDERQADQVISLIQRLNQGLDSKKIRIKISTGRGFYNLDPSGVGVSSSGEAVKIDIQKLKQLLCE